MIYICTVLYSLQTFSHLFMFITTCEEGRAEVISHILQVRKLRFTKVKPQIPYKWRNQVLYPVLQITKRTVW